MIAIDRNRCCGCGKCVTIVITLKTLYEKDNIEFYQEPPDMDSEYIDNIMMECWAQCIYRIKD